MKITSKYFPCRPTLILAKCYCKHVSCPYQPTFHPYLRRISFFFFNKALASTIAAHATTCSSISKEKEWCGARSPYCLEYLSYLDKKSAIVDRCVYIHCNVMDVDSRRRKLKQKLKQNRKR